MPSRSILAHRPALWFALALAALGSLAARAQSAPAGQEVNLATVATPSASYVSGDTSLLALNDGYNPRNSADNRRGGSYGNWNRTGTQWVQYDWSKPVSTSRIDVYWWADGRGIKLPKASRLMYWDGKAFTPVGHPQGLGVEANHYNTTTFDEVATTRLRLEMDGDGNDSTGILEWKVIDSGKSPKFPPVVTAGHDRLNVLGSPTYLMGKSRGGSGDQPARYAWSKESGPGSVEFDNAGALETSAKLSAPGEYILKLTATVGDLSSSSTLSVKAEEPPPAGHLDPVFVSRWKLDSKLWNGRAKALIVNWIPHCYNLLSDPKLREGGINNFVQAGNKLAGKPYTRHQGYPFADAYTLNTVESICVALMIDPQGDQEIIDAQQAMRAKLEDWIPKILSAQEPDGYLQTRFTLDPANTPHWNERMRGEHEGYVAGYFIEAALAHYEMTGRTDARMYQAAKRLADCWERNLGPEPKKPWYDGHQEMEQALVRLGRFVNANEGAGKGQKYITLAKFLLDCRGEGSEYDQSHQPVIKQYEAVGHAVRAAYTYSAMADIAMETGDRAYQSAVRSIWDNIVNRKYYVTGGIGSGETSEGFGPDYSLPNGGYCESCSGCGELFFQHKMNLLWREAKYADLYEETLYNAILGDFDLEGKNFYYQNPLDSGSPRYAWHNCPCCVGNIPRVLLELPTWMYARAVDGVYVNLFIGSTVALENIAGTRVELIQKTDYPWSGKVSITVNPAEAKRFAIRIRVPNRDASELYHSAPEMKEIKALSVNGEPLTPALEKGYAVVERSWKPGDKIELELPLEPQRVTASEKIGATRGRVALRLGPLVYNTEQADQQDLNQILSQQSPLATEWRGDLLGGVTVIKGAFEGGGQLLAIPNYARNNRVPAAPAGVPNRRGRQVGGSIVWMRSR